MSMKRLIESLGRNQMTSYALKAGDDVAVGDIKSRDGAPRGPFRYLSGTGVESVSADTANYLLSRLNNNKGQILDEKKFRVKQGDTFVVKPLSVHKITNISNIPLVIIEVQCGEITEENDIVRMGQ
jgi:hypothetical protein